MGEEAWCIVGVQCHARWGLDPLSTVNRNCNVRAYNVFLYNCVISMLWQLLGKDPHMGGIVKCVVSVS